jgi:CheY-like chemotaxis protein
VLDDDVVFAVADQGRGIPLDRQEQIFGWFEQVDASDAREKGGSGLGLAICKAIVEGHRGRIWVESRPGAGSTFSFSIPRGDLEPRAGGVADRSVVTVDSLDTGSEEASPLAPAATNGVGAADAAGRLTASVLIVEDDADLAGVLAQMLEDRHTRVRRVLDLAGALREIDDFDPDVVLLDLNLPDGEGSTIVNAIADGTLETDATVIVHTARDVVGLERTVLRLGSSEIHRKGRLAPDELASRVAAVAHGQARNRKHAPSDGAARSEAKE